MTFAELGLHRSLTGSCEALGFSEPTPIQERAIPVILGGSDLIGCAATGTGKTAAFLLPLLQNLLTKPGKGVRALILSPTRELAAQTADHLAKLDAQQRACAVTIVGGANANKQRVALRGGANVAIATPGRLIDHIETRAINLTRVELLVLDEADRMLDLGFLPAIRHIIELLPSERQTLLFSATMPPAIAEIARRHMRRHTVINVSPRSHTPITIKQTAYPVALESKTNLLLHLLERERFERVLVFTRTRRGAERLSRLLAARLHQVERLHADRTQPQRDAALRGFRVGQFRVLVATDIAARGIDVDAISHVINYDVPDIPEDYVHRIGRTGRAGHAGQALTLLTPVDELSMLAIEKLTGERVERIVLPGFGGAVAVFNRPTPHFSGRRSASIGVRSFSPRRAGR